MSKRKFILTTSMALVSISAMAHAAALAEEEDLKNGTLDGKLRAAFDRKNIANDEAPEPQELEQIRNIYSKKAVRMAIEDNFNILVRNYGENGQTLKQKYFDDIKDKVMKVSLPASTGTQDSTNINNAQVGGGNSYDNCNLNPTKTGVNYAEPGQGCICHGACHGQCLTPGLSSSLKALNKSIRVDSKDRETLIMGHVGGDDVLSSSFVLSVVQRTITCTELHFSINNFGKDNDATLSCFQHNNNKNRGQYENKTHINRSRFNTSIYC